jgi:hypothetical protein
MWLSIAKMAFQTGAHVIKNRQQTKMLVSDAERLHAQKMANGEVEYKKAVMANNNQGWKDEFVLILVSAPVMLLIWSIFSEDPEIMMKVEMFFEYFNNMPFWYQALFIGVVSAIYGLKGADIIKKKIMIRNFKDIVILLITSGVLLLLGVIIIGDYVVALEENRPVDESVITLMKMSVTGLIGVIGGYIGGSK